MGSKNLPAKTPQSRRLLRLLWFKFGLPSPKHSDDETLHGAMKNSRDSRHRTRLETCQPASASAQGVRLACEIRNYCRVGLYLRFTDSPETHRLAAAWHSHTLVEVVFTAIVQGQAQLFRILGAAAHVSEVGAGLAVPSMPEEAILALQAAAPPAQLPAAEQPASAVATQAPAAQHRANDTSAQADDAPLAAMPEPRDELQAQCATLFERAMQGVFQDLFGSLDASFEIAHNKSPDVLERRRLFEAPGTVRMARRQLEKGFFDSALEHRQQLLLQAAVPALAEQSSDELSLLGEAEFEDWLNMTAVVNRLEYDGLYGPALVLVERHYGQLTGQPLDRQRNPFGPAVICKCFHLAVQAIALCNGSRAVLYQAFGHALQRRLPGLVEQLADPLTVWAEAMAEQAKNEPAALLATFRQEQEPAISAAAQQTAALPALQATGSQALITSKDRPAANAPFDDGGYADPPAMPPRRSLLAVAHGLLHPTDQAWVAGGMPTPSADALPAAPGSAAGLDELVSVIDAMARAGWMGLRGAVQTPLSVQLSNAAGGLHIPAQAQTAIDHAASLLGKTQLVSGGGAAIDDLIKRLEQPLLKMALREGGFPDHTGHPARQVLDLLEQFAIAVDDGGRFFETSLQRYLHRAVDRICSQSDLDPSVYTRIRDSLTRLLKPLKTARQLRVSRLQEICESRHRLHLARCRVDEALQARLADRDVPQIVLALLDAGWRQALVLLECRVGQQDERWTCELGAVDELLALLTQEPGESSVERRRSVWALSGRIETLLGNVNPELEDRDTLISELQSTLDAVVRGPVFLKTGRYVAPAAAPLDAAQTPETGHPQMRAPLQLRVGNWWQVQSASAWLPMQLIWCSTTAQDLAFTNRSATRLVELTLQDFQQRLRQGTIKEGADQTQPLVERSVQALLDEGRAQVLQRGLRDPVTGLLSRKGLLQRLSKATGCSSDKHTHLVAIIEFDQFRVVSQACGVVHADALARALAGEVSAGLGQEGLVASFRDDTLAVFIEDGLRAQGLQRLNALLSKLSDYRFNAEGQSFSIGVNIGVAEFTYGLHNPDAAVQQADMACVAAKTQGRNRVQFFESDSRQLRTQQDLVDWAGRIDSLLSGTGLHVRAQMVMPIAADSPLEPYYEVLLGIELTPGRTLSPLPFVMAMEGLRRAHELDLWVLHRVFEWIRHNRAVFATLGGLSINLSAMSLAHNEVIDTLRDYLLAGDIPAERISFEITETAAIQSYGAAADFIRQMRRFGCRFALDDFGSGHTSYSHLKNLSADVMKIDGSFVKDIVESPADFAIVKSMNDIAHSLGMHTVAEYVESPAILAKLREIGVDYAQGYAIHKPCRLDQFLVRAAA